MISKISGIKISIKITNNPQKEWIAEKSKEIKWLLSDFSLIKNISSK